MIRVLVTAAALVAATPSVAAEPAPADRAALLQIAEHMDRAWNEADAVANADLFAANATGRFGEDPLGQGRDAIREQFHSFFKDRPPGLRHVTKIERMEQLGPDFAMWDAEVMIERKQATGDWARVTRIRSVTLVNRQAGRWRIQAVRAFPIR